MGGRPATSFAGGLFGLLVAVVAREEAEGDGVVLGQAVAVEAETDFALCVV